MAMPKKDPPAGAPEWVLTYGDMMSLLLCFFILLAAMANYDKHDKMLMTSMESIRRAFGSPGQWGFLLDEQVSLNSLPADLFHITRTHYSKQRGESNDEGTKGENDSVRAVRRFDEYQVDHAILFDRFSATLSPAADEALAQAAENLRGHRTKIEIRGHASREPLPADAPFADAMVLSLARAQAVQSYLIAHGVEPERIRVSAAGPYEPAVVRGYTPESVALNHRVELFVYPTTVEDYEHAARDGTEESAQP